MQVVPNLLPVHGSSLPRQTFLVLRFVLCLSVCYLCLGLGELRFEVPVSPDLLSEPALQLICFPLRGPALFTVLNAPFLHLMNLQGLLIELFLQSLGLRHDSCLSSAVSSKVL